MIYLIMAMAIAFTMQTQPKYLLYAESDVVKEKRCSILAQALFGIGLNEQGLLLTTNDSTKLNLTLMYKESAKEPIFLSVSTIPENLMTANQFNALFQKISRILMDDIDTLYMSDPAFEGDIPKDFIMGMPLTFGPLQKAWKENKGMNAFEPGKYVKGWCDSIDALHPQYQWWIEYKERNKIKDHR